METPIDHNDVVENLNEVKAEIKTACLQAQRKVSNVTLVAVSKFHDADRIRPTLDAGHRCFGENRVQEAQSKWSALRQDFSDVSVHLIGPLQTNKIKQAVEIFDVIESVDREKLARALAKTFTETGKPLAIFIQVNTGEEPQKAGILPQEVDAFVTLCRDDLNLNVKGLMCIPPIDEEPSLHFALLSKLAKRNHLAELSMGMSGDFASAIDLGATHVRIGTAIFGKRD